MTGQKRTRSTKTGNKREADRFAARLEEDLTRGERGDVQNMTWAEARRLYELEEFPRLAPKTRDKLSDTFRLVERVINPHRLAAVGENEAAAMCRDLRSHERSEFTVKSHLSVLRRFLRWCHRRGILARVPTISIPARTVGGMKGRPPTREEFERMLAATVHVVGPQSAPDWQRFLEGLWLSGLRLAEALALHWTDNSEITVDLDGKRPMFRIQAATDKTRKFRVFPIAAEFAQFLDAVFPQDRRGFVFNLNNARGRRPSMDTASKTIAQIGERAGVKVAEIKRRKGEPKIKWASAHDLRRAFGFRWSLRVLPAILMLLMRHESIQTTMQFYVGRDAETAAEEMWRAVGNTFGNTGASETPDPKSANHVTDFQEPT
ncbi:MAG: site-specific integrase [Planctomycetota bacterium]|nr:site-specific integrase [Planctomycetota bacterium]